MISTRSIYKTMTRFSFVYFLQPSALLWLGVLLSLLLFVTQANAQGILHKVRVGQDSEKTRIVFDLKDKPSYKVIRPKDSSQIIVQFSDVKNHLDYAHRSWHDSRLAKLDVANKFNQIEVTLQLRGNLKISSFYMSENDKGLERLVVDLRNAKKVAKEVVETVEAKAPENELISSKPEQITEQKGVNDRESLQIVADKRQQETIAEKSIEKPQEAKVKRVANKALNVQKKSPENETSVVETSLPTAKLDQLIESLANEVNGREVVIAIDAGHGGKDPGAINPHSQVMEKNITLQMAKWLKRLIDSQPNMRAVLTRDRDIFIPLHKRVKIAKAQNADMFISIHADAFHDHTVRGGSVYVLSRGGASSSMARLLAKSENAYLQDVNLKGFDNDVAYALSDLSRQANIDHSRKLAGSVLREMKKQVVMHKDSLQSARFAVLKSIDIPSMLIETAFLSNPTEARQLKDPKFQYRMAKAIVSGLKSYVAENVRQPQTEQELYVRYTVKPGDTLSEIASRFDVSVLQLKKLNNMKDSNHLYSGKLLRIPVSEPLLSRLEDLT